jgi:deoxyribose-phosphate aldolase
MPPAPRDSRDLLERAAAAPGDAAAARRALPLLDLTSLNEDDTEERIARLCARAAEHRVAAACIHPRFLPVARGRLAGSGVRLATVANFPHGGDDLARTADEVAAAVAEGAEEVDVVIPVQAVLAGDVGLVAETVELCRAAGAEAATLKVILETGVLKEPDVITAAARAAIMAGADFLKTSTGKAGVGATLEAAAILLAVIDEAEGRVGLKLAGGVRTAAQAAGYLHLVDRFIGPAWASPATVRFGASSLLDDLLAASARG